MSRIYKEYMTTSGLFRNIVCVELTSEHLQLMSMGFTLKNVSMTAIQEVRLYRDWLGKAVSVSYVDANGLINYAQWATRRLEQWRKAFQSINVRIDDFKNGACSN